MSDPEGYLQDLMALPTPFKENGLVSAGNSWQIVDGAAAVLLMSASEKSVQKAIFFMESIKHPLSSIDWFAGCDSTGNFHPVNGLSLEMIKKS